MKMLTHVVFGAGTVAALAPTLPADLRLSLALVLSIVVNPVIDDLGHARRKGFVARSPLTHSVLTAPVWGGAVGYAVWMAGSTVGVVSASSETVVIIYGVVVAASHLLLDSMTERGVYVVTKRFALAHFGSGNVILNGVFVACGLILLLL